MKPKVRHLSTKGHPEHISWFLQVVTYPRVEDPYDSIAVGSAVWDKVAFAAKKESYM